MLFFKKKQSPKPNESPKTEDPFEQLTRNNEKMNKIIARTAQETGENTILKLRESPVFKELMEELDEEFKKGTTIDESPSVAGFSSENPTIPNSLEELLGMPSAGTPPTTTAWNEEKVTPATLEELLKSFPQGPSGHEEIIKSDTKEAGISGHCKNKTSPEPLGFFEQANNASKGRTPAEQEWLDRLKRARESLEKGKGKGKEGTISGR